MKYDTLVSLLLLLFLFDSLFSQTVENLDELHARKTRIATNVYPVDKLEDASNNHVWQPETLMYKDSKTGREVWKLSNTPGLLNYYNNDIGVSPWSADGKRMSFASRRKTYSFTTDWWIWMIVDTNGKNLFPGAKSAGRVCDSFNAYFHWSPQIPDEYYEVGRSGIYTNDSVYKISINETDTSAELLFRFPKSVKLDKMISADGRKLLVSSYDESWVFPSTIYPSPGIVVPDGYSIDRKLGLYGTTPAAYAIAHDRYYAGDGTWYFIMPIGGANRAWWRLKNVGSASDGGALYNNSDFPVKDSAYDFGEAWPVNCDSGANPDPFGSTYWSHFVPDRWGRMALFSNSNTNVPPRGYGPGTWDIQKNMYPVYSYGGGAQHHDWHGFTDWVVSSRGPSTNGYINDRIYVAKYDDINSQNTVCHTYTRSNGGTNYNSLVRPGQSPDGTKVSWQSEFLSNAANATEVFWAVCYYPYPPTNLEVSYSNGVKISWLPPKYTERGWPYAKTNYQKESKGGWPVLDINGNEIGEPLFAREIKRYHIWRSANFGFGWQEIGSLEAEYSSFYSEDVSMLMLHPVFGGVKVSSSNKISYMDSVADGVWYYALTSEEHSGLESDELSEILQVTVNGSDIVSQVTAAKGQKNFWKNIPANPSNVTYTLQTTPGQYLIIWTEPQDSKIRYYNIYYSNISSPACDPQHRIASVSKGISKYLDWLADKDNGGYYKVTSVDRYGNEGVYSQSGLPPPNLLSVSKT